jgi:hypothetical protein
MRSADESHSDEGNSTHLRGFARHDSFESAVRLHVDRPQMSGRSAAQRRTDLDARWWV